LRARVDLKVHRTGRITRGFSRRCSTGRGERTLPSEGAWRNCCSSAGKTPRTRRRLQQPRHRNPSTSSVGKTCIPFEQDGSRGPGSVRCTTPSENIDTSGPGPSDAAQPPPKNHDTGRDGGSRNPADYGGKSRPPGGRAGGRDDAGGCAAKLAAQSLWRARRPYDNGNRGRTLAKAIRRSQTQNRAGELPAAAPRGRATRRSRCATARNPGIRKPLSLRPFFGEFFRQLHGEGNFLTTNILGP